MRSTDFDTSVVNGVQVMRLILGHRARPSPGVLKLRCLKGCARLRERAPPLTYPLLCSPPQDLRYFKSEKTSRGILQEGWRDTQHPIMCSYKLVTVKFEVWGLQTRVEQFVHKVRGHGTALRLALLCTLDERRGAFPSCLLQLQQFWPLLC